MSRILIIFIKLYQYCISPLIIPSCRFSPTCSQYAIEAYEKYGFLQGTRLSIWRILRCNPWSKGGYEPVP
ncbi:MAG: membrane protein insertion efficiency factor YidD [Nitrosomonas sp. PRO4]|nr:membrane protein insertion efficiency factor YidD [Nitrosomonas sp. PRO4]